MIKKLLFFDSQDGIKNYDVNATDTNIKYYHPYNLYFTLVNPISNIKRIYLKSVELPIALYNVRSTGSMNLCSVGWIVTGQSGGFDYRVTAGFYKLDNLLGTSGVGAASVQAALQVGGVKASYSFSSTTGTNGFTICQLTHNATSFTIKDSFLMNSILGFSSGTYTSSPISGTTPINICPDTHLYMFITNIQSNNNNTKPATFKIPLGSYLSPPAYTHYEDNNEQQQITVSSNTFILDKLNIIIYDKFGYALQGYLDWSFSILIEYEEFQEQQFLNFNN